jgi:hypothetical protein
VATPSLRAFHTTIFIPTQGESMSSITLPNRCIRLLDPGDAIGDPVVTSRPDDPSPFEPFPLPGLPLSQHYWLNGLADHFFECHQRGIALLLILDVAQPGWCTPHVPTQRCDSEGASFRLSPADLTALCPGMRIAGSFQSCTSHTDDEIRALVPAYDGLHFVRVIGDTPRFGSFLCHNGKVELAHPAKFLLDDWQHYIGQRQDRFTLA